MEIFFKFALIVLVIAFFVEIFKCVALIEKIDKSTSKSK